MSSFEHLKIVNGIILATYQGSCKELGLLEEDEYCKNTFSDSAISELAVTLRELLIS